LVIGEFRRQRRAVWLLVSFDGSGALFGCWWVSHTDFSDGDGNGAVCSCSELVIFFFCEKMRGVLFYLLLDAFRFQSQRGGRLCEAKAEVKPKPIVAGVGLDSHGSNPNPVESDFLLLNRLSSLSVLLQSQIDFISTHHHAAHDSPPLNVDNNKHNGKDNRYAGAENGGGQENNIKNANENSNNNNNNNENPQDAGLNNAVGGGGGSGGGGSGAEGKDGSGAQNNKDEKSNDEKQHEKAVKDKEKHIMDGLVAKNDIPNPHPIIIQGEDESDRDAKKGGRQVKMPSVADSTGGNSKSASAGKLLTIFCFFAVKFNLDLFYLFNFIFQWIEL
jgi:hypothetical protein